MEKTSKISVGQFFSLLFLSRLLSVLTWSPAYGDTMNSSDLLLSGFIGMIIIAVFAVPLFILFKNNGTSPLMPVGKTTEKVISVMYTALFGYFAFSTLSRLDLFAGTVIFPDSDTTLFVLISVIMACYSASLGLEALGRAGVISVFLFSEIFFQSSPCFVLKVCFILLA